MQNDNAKFKIELTKKDGTFNFDIYILNFYHG